MTAMTFGKYRIVEKVGAGGFGEVFKGLDPILNRHVAIKTCSSDEDELRRRFLREAEIAAGLQHPNIVTVFDFGYQGETPYLVQEYLSGEDLDHKIKRRDPLSVKTKLSYLSKIADGLRYAHSHDVIHRDVKPANVRVLDDGQLRVMDFGIAKLMTAETQLTRTGMALGTAAYLPPEQLFNRPLDLRADQFSFGVLAYELMTGEQPFGGDSLSTILYAIAHKAPVQINSQWPQCPPRLATMIDTCLAKEPERRYPGFAEVIAELEAISGSLTPDAAQAPQIPPPPTHAPPPLPPQRKTIPLTAGQVAVQRPVSAPGSRRPDSRKLTIALIAAILVIIVGLAALLVAKRYVGGKTPQTATTTTPAPPSAVDVPALEPEAEQPASGELQDQTSTGPQETPSVEQPAPEQQPTTRQDTATPTTRPMPAPASRSSSPPPESDGERSAETTPSARTEDTPETPVPTVASEPTVSEPAVEPTPLISNQSHGMTLGRLTPGERVYVDRDFIYGLVPREYFDLPCLKTPNDLRRNASVITFTLGQPADVFVIHDKRVTKKPPWLGLFYQNGHVVTVKEGGEKQAVIGYDVYVRSFPAGEVSLGSSAPPRQRRKHRISMYTVCVQPR